MPLIIPSNSISGEFEVANSLRFDDGSSDNLTRTLGTPTSTKKCSISFWVKLSNLSAEKSIFEHRFNDGTNKQISLFFSSSDNLQLQLVTGGSYDGRIYTSQLFRDLSAWYHVLIAIDTTLATSGDRLRMYVNGNEVTSFSTELQPSQNYDMHFTSGQTLHIGKNSSSSAYYDGYMAEYVFIDGQALDPTSFGEFDEDTGIWKPINVSGLTFGTNGFYLDFENSGSLGNDKSGNGNNFTVYNLTSIDQTTDTPTLNYATLNPLNVPTSNAPTFSEGNLKTVCGTTGGAYMGSSTIGVSSGKWYAEMKVKTVDSVLAGISANASEDARDNVYPGQQADSVGILLSNGQKYINDSGSTYGTSLSANDILQIALDLDNNNVYFGKNGQWSNGSGSWNQSSPSSAISITASSNTTDGFYFFSVGDGGGSQAGDVEWNFGNPAFTISSGNSDGNGYGNFEHAVPSGYYSLNTKNLAEFG